MQNQVRRKLEQGKNLLGMMHFTGSPMLIEVMASAGMDFVNIDMGTVRSTASWRRISSARLTRRESRRSCASLRSIQD
jgi:2-keto-3-deoxy-L-rhamnonate aldolase RhmA